MKGAAERPKRTKNPPEHRLFMAIRVSGPGFTRTYGYPQKVLDKMLHRERWQQFSDGSMHNIITLRKNKRDYPELPPLP